MGTAPGMSTTCRSPPGRRSGLRWTRRRAGGGSRSLDGAVAIGLEHMATQWLTAQGAGPARRNRDAMERVVDRLAAAERPTMTGHDLTVLPACRPVGIGADLDGTTDRAGVDRVAVRQGKGPLDLFLILLTVEPQEAGPGGGRGDGKQAVERADMGHQAPALLLEHLPDRLVRNVGVPVRLGMGGTAILGHSPLVRETLANAIAGPTLADEDRVHRRLRSTVVPEPMAIKVPLS